MHFCIIWWDAVVHVIMALSVTDLYQVTIVSIQVMCDNQGPDITGDNLHVWGLRCLQGLTD